ncbi:MAG: hypothetical protein CL489_10600 [Acidobacteria bacterium]|nr:hypothetical protein [Acidobacteriota bacterium]|tara:strand:+ start:202 stop:792 length:591 start_codon:yes stop_codon:yes gene_type:complete
MYEDYKLYGPYTRKDGRKHVCLVHKETGKRKTVSYPKYLMENHLRRFLTDDETVDHIDCDFTNNAISNLRVMDRSQHSREDVKRLKPVEFECPMCSTSFSLEGDRLRTFSKNLTQDKAGPFCSRKCAGLYGAKVQNGMERLPPAKEIFERDYTTLKIERIEGNFNIEPDEFGETLTVKDDGDPDPSPKDGEGVETT